MNNHVRRTLFAVAMAVVGVCIANAGPSSAAPVPNVAPPAPTAPMKGPARIAVVDTSRVFAEMQETQEFKGKLEAERNKLKNEETDRKANIEKLRQSRALYKAGSAELDKLNDDILQEGIKFEIWGKYAGAQAERNQKKLLKSLFEKIEEATQQYAQQEGIDLVLVKQTPDLPDNLEGITFDQLRSLINQRQVIYAGSKVDISSAVLVMVDAKYRSGGGVKIPVGRSDSGPGAEGSATTAADKTKPSDAAAPRR